MGRGVGSSRDNDPQGCHQVGQAALGAHRPRLQQSLSSFVICMSSLRFFSHLSSLLSLVSRVARPFVFGHCAAEEAKLLEVTSQVRKAARLFALSACCFLLSVLSGQGCLPGDEAPSKDPGPGVGTRPLPTPGHQHGSPLPPTGTHEAGRDCEQAEGRSQPVVHRPSVWCGAAALLTPLSPTGRAEAWQHRGKSAPDGGPAGGKEPRTAAGTCPGGAAAHLAVVEDEAQAGGVGVGSGPLFPTSPHVDTRPLLDPIRGTVHSCASWMLVNTPSIWTMFSGRWGPVGSAA